MEEFKRIFVYGSDSVSDFVSSITKRDVAPVAVVEEHHDVIRWWDLAVKARMLPKQEVTLLHIDGHSDMAVPSETSFTDKFPYFYYPKNKHQLDLLMEKNDEFIFAAAATKFIDKVYWVFPDWTKNSDATVQVPQFKCKVSLGIQKKQNKKNQTSSRWKRDGYFDIMRPNQTQHSSHKPRRKRKSREAKVAAC